MFVHISWKLLPSDRERNVPKIFAVIKSVKQRNFCNISPKCHCVADWRYSSDSRPSVNCVQ